MSIPDKQQTKIGVVKDIISSIHALSIDIRDKALELTTAPSPSEDEAAKASIVTDNVSNELIGSLNNVRGILREAYDTLKEFN